MKVTLKPRGALAAALLLWSAAAPAAQPADPDLEALREEVARLREEVKALWAAPPPPEAGKSAGASAAAPQEEGPTLEERVDLVEVKQQDAVVVGDSPATFRIPGSDVSLRVYGFAELQWIHDLRADNLDIDYATFMPYVPLRGSPGDGRRHRDYLTARTSRLGVEATTPTRFGALGVKLEGDFNNEPRLGNTAAGTDVNDNPGEDGDRGDNQTILTLQQTSSFGFRIRHAYGQVGGLLAGMTWSTFMDVDNSPETVDFNGPIGSTFIRQALLRYTYATGGLGKFTLALENPLSYVLDASGTVMDEGFSVVPDVVLRWDGSYQWGSVSARAMTLEHRVDDGADIEAASRGYGLGTTALVKVRGSDLLSLGVTFGEGIGRYLNYIEGAVYDSTEDDVLLERAGGVVAAYQLRPVDRLRFNFVYGVTRNWDNDYTAFARANGLDTGRFGINRWVHQAHAGAIVTLLPAVDMGLEAIWGQRRTLAGDIGDMFRLNLALRYTVN